MAVEQPAYPSRTQVEAAQERVRSAERSVAAIRADLALAGTELERLAVEAAKASEDYNGAVWELKQARKDARQAQRRARRQGERLDVARARIGSLVADTYQGGSSFGQMSAYLGSEDEHRLLDRVAAYKGASDSLAADFDTFAAQQALAQVYRDTARSALRTADEAAARARSARQVAADAVAAQQAAVSSIGERRDALLHELAEAQDISVELATERQEALERIERERRAREAAARAEAERRAEARRQAELREQREAQATAQRRAERRAQRAAGREADRRAQQRTDREAARRAAQRREAERRAAERRAAERRAAERAEEQQSDPPPSSSGGAQAAVDFARAQLGDPYQWGGNGNPGWDCSGLTTAAWRAGGTSIPRNSALQYGYSTPISYGDLRPGDLVFWSSNGSAGGIYHVGLYIGGGQMIHAPNSNTVVRTDSIWYMGTPSHYGRV